MDKQTSPRPFSSHLAAIGQKIKRRLSNDGQHPRVLGDEESIASTIVEKKEEKSRSASRGREVFQSSGRGGFGNIRPKSVSRDPAARHADSDDYLAPRGREPIVNRDSNEIISTGRGGAGNIRSPSREARTPQREIELEKEVLKKHLESADQIPHSSGRGGFGNIISSSSPSRVPASAATPVHSTGRGGLGNMKTGDPVAIEIFDDEERSRHGHSEEVHSTGRGGAANITDAITPPVEHHLHPHRQGELESTGRGGAGNIRDRSADTDHRRSQDKHGVTGLWDKVAHPGHHNNTDPAESTTKVADSAPAVPRGNIQGVI